MDSGVRPLTQALLACARHHGWQAMLRAGLGVHPLCTCFVVGLGGRLCVSGATTRLCCDASSPQELSQYTLLGMFNSADSISMGSV